MTATSVKTPDPPDPPNPEPLLTPEQTARLLGVSKDHLRRLRKQDDGPPYVRVSERIVRYRLADVRAWIEARRIEGDAGGLE